MKKNKLNVLNIANIIVLIASVVGVVMIESGSYRYRILLLSLIVFGNFLWYAYRERKIINRK